MAGGAARRAGYANQGLTKFAVVIADISFVGGKTGNCRLLSPSSGSRSHATTREVTEWEQKEYFDLF
jgi:hypothetical protein